MYNTYNVLPSNDKYKYQRKYLEISIFFLYIHCIYRYNQKVGEYSLAQKINKLTYTSLLYFCNFTTKNIIIY